MCVCFLSSVVQMWLSVCLMEGSEKLGVMIPIPQYPLYTACIAELGAEPVRMGIIRIPHRNITDAITQ